MKIYPSMAAAILVSFGVRGQESSAQILRGIDMYEMKLPESCSELPKCKSCLFFGCTFDNGKCSGTNPPVLPDLTFQFIFDIHKKCAKQNEVQNMCDRVSFTDLPPGIDPEIVNDHGDAQMKKIVEKLKQDGWDWLKKYGPERAQEYIKEKFGGSFPGLGNRRL